MRKQTDMDYWHIQSVLVFIEIELISLPINIFNGKMQRSIPNAVSFKFRPSFSPENIFSTRYIDLRSGSLAHDGIRPSDGLGIYTVCTSNEFGKLPFYQ